MSSATYNNYKVSPETQDLKRKLNLFVLAFIKKAGWNTVDAAKYLKSPISITSELMRNNLNIASVDYMLKLLIRVGANVSFDSGKLTVLLPKKNVHSAISINMPEDKINEKVFELKKTAASYVVKNVRNADGTIYRQAENSGLNKSRLYQLVRDDYSNLTEFSLEYILMVTKQLNLFCHTSIRYKD